MVQVIRNEYVTNVPVRVLGETGPERVQITGLLRRSDSLIVSSSVSLLAGTLVRFGEGTASRGVEGVSPNPAYGGADAGISCARRLHAPARRAVPGSATNQTRPGDHAAQSRGRAVLGQAIQINNRFDHANGSVSTRHGCPGPPLSPDVVRPASILKA